MARYVSERELAFDARVLGFPSIQGCHAILYVTATGLFGYHSVGGETPDKWPPITAALLDFFRNHGSGGGDGAALYGACFLTGIDHAVQHGGGTGATYSKRAYAGDARQSWIAELTAFAEALRFKGPIFGHDLGAVPGIGRSAYVEFEKVGERCVTQVKPWQESDATSALPVPTPDLQRWPGPSKPLSPANKITIVAVDADGLKTIYPQRLR